MSERYLLVEDACGVVYVWCAVNRSCSVGSLMERLQSRYDEADGTDKGKWLRVRKGCERNGIATPEDLLANEAFRMHEWRNFGLGSARLLKQFVKQEYGVDLNIDMYRV